MCHRWGGESTRLDFGAEGPRIVAEAVGWEPATEGARPAGHEPLGLLPRAGRVQAAQGRAARRERSGARGAVASPASLGPLGGGVGSEKRKLTSNKLVSRLARFRLWFINQRRLTVEV